MPKPRLADIQHLLENLMLPFYQIERDMALPFQGGRNENDAEHSWSVALLACALAPQVDPTLDIGKVAQFALVHDLVETFAGDTSVWAEQKELATKEKREKAALQKITEQFPAFPWVAETIADYERKDSPEANFVWALDKLLALYVRHLDKGAFFKKRKITMEHFDEHLAPVQKKAHAHPGIKFYFEELRALVHSHPEYFYKP